MKLSRTRWLAAVIVLVVAVDWAAKGLVQHRLAIRVPHPVLDGWLSLVHTTNYGISWGGLGGTETWWRFPLIVALSLVGIAALASIVRSSRDVWLRVAGALVLGGAVGNFGDRLLNGGVTDYIYVHFFPFIFNFADVAITMGGAVLAARMWLEKPAEDAAPAAGA